MCVYSREVDEVVLAHAMHAESLGQFVLGESYLRGIVGWGLQLEVEGVLDCYTHTTHTRTHRMYVSHTHTNTVATWAKESPLFWKVTVFIGTMVQMVRRVRRVIRVVLVVDLLIQVELVKMVVLERQMDTLA